MSIERLPVLGEEALPLGLRALGADQVVEPGADELLVRAAVEAARRMVDGDEPPLGVEHDDDVHRRVENRLQLLSVPCHALDTVAILPHVEYAFELSAALFLTRRQQH